MSMEGPTIHWFNLRKDSTKELTWTNFKEDLTIILRVKHLENPFKKVKTLKHTTLVEDYIVEFELYSS